VPRRDRFGALCRAYEQVGDGLAHRAVSRTTVAGTTSLPSAVLRPAIWLEGTVASHL